MARLLTHHDPMHLHALNGLLALIHLFYRLRMLCVHGTTFPSTEPLTLSICCLSIHVALHLTSFLLPLPKTRNFSSPMIWPEFRAHNAVFGVRQALCSVVALLTERALQNIESDAPMEWLVNAVDHILLVSPSITVKVVGLCVRLCLVLTATWLATVVTKTIGDTVLRTTNSMPYPSIASDEDVIATKGFYRQCQFHATALAVVGDSTFAFLPLYGLESAPFMMTMVRKGFVTSLWYHRVYTACLLVPYFAMSSVGPKEMVGWTICGNLARYARVKGKANHYTIWPVNALLFVVIQSLLESTPTGTRVLHILARSGVTYITLEHLYFFQWMLNHSPYRAYGATKPSSPSSSSSPSASSDSDSNDSNGVKSPQSMSMNERKKRKAVERVTSVDAKKGNRDDLHDNLLMVTLVVLFGAVSTGIAYDQSGGSFV